jgi:hypothetical protein
MPTPPRSRMISAETSESRQPLCGRFASLDMSAAAKEQQLRGGDGEGPGRHTHTDAAPAVTHVALGLALGLALERPWQPGYLRDAL